jgi:hypothetical protein
MVLNFEANQHSNIISHVWNSTATCVEMGLFLCTTFLIVTSFRFLLLKQELI